MTHYIPSNLTDPQKLQKEYPDTVHAIDPFYWDLVKVGDYVRIRGANEYFWLQVRAVSETSVTGEVYYELGINPYKIGDTLAFSKCFQFDIYDPLYLNLIPGIDV